MTREEVIQMLRLYEVNEIGEGELKTWYHGIDKDMREALDMAIDALQFQDIMISNPKTAKPTPEVCKNCKNNTQDDWIPVSEPPKENGKYLVSVDGYWKFVDIFKYDVVKETWYALDKKDNYGTDWNKCITAWQPMPKIYRSLNNYNDDDYNSCETSQGDWLAGGICSKCGYDITPDLDWGENAPEYCPKCNTKLR